MQKTPRRCVICGTWTTSTSPRPAYCSPACRRAGAADAVPELIRRLKARKDEQTPPK